MAFFNPYRQSYLDDPYPALARLREHDPVYWSAEFSAWIVTSYEDCSRVLRDPARFSSNASHEAVVGQSAIADSLNYQREHSRSDDSVPLVRSDPPEHTRIRQAIHRAFTPRAVENMRGPVERIVGELLAGLEDGAPFDFMAQVASPLAVRVLIEVVGVPPADREGFTALLVDTQKARADLRRDRETELRAVTAEREIFAYFGDLVEHPHDLIEGSMAWLLIESGVGFEPAEQRKMLYDLSISGNNSTPFFLGNAMRALVWHPKELAKIRERPELLRGAVDEVLRYDGPTQQVIRFATVDAQIGGRPVKAGDAIFVMVGSAGRDGSEFPDPDRFDIERRALAHLNFGTGIHHCIGMPLVRMEAEILLSSIIDRFPVLELARGGLRRGGTLALHGPLQLTLIGRPE